MGIHAREWGDDALGDLGRERRRLFTESSDVRIGERVVLQVPWWNRAEESAVGFDRSRIEPDMPAGLEWVDASYESVRGTIKSSWRLESDRLYFDVEIPVNTTALVQLPTRDSMSVREAGRLIAEVSSIRKRPATTPDAVRFELGSGRYPFTALAP